MSPWPELWGGQQGCVEARLPFSRPFGRRILYFDGAALRLLVTSRTYDRGLSMARVDSVNSHPGRGGSITRIAERVRPSHRAQQRQSLEALLGRGIVLVG
jgi:hypothetical protein